MTSEDKIEEIVAEVAEEHGQSGAFADRFMKFYDNALENNLGGTSLERLIEQVELPTEEEIDEP
jgi:hypothetical protein